MKQTKATTLSASLKEDRRYLVLLVKNRENAKESVESAILKYVGILGYAKAGPMIIETGVKGDESYAILAINRKSLEQIKAACSLSKIRCIGVSGTIKQVRRFL